MYNEFCLPDNAQISHLINAPVRCGFGNSTEVSGEGVWTGPDGTTSCTNDTSTGAINCSLSQNVISLQLSTASEVGSYTCTHSGGSITVLVTSTLIYVYDNNCDIRANIAFVVY